MRNRMTLLAVPVATLLLALGVLPAAAPAADDGWMTSHPQALEKAEKTGKVVLADFTGSDWCVWCKRLDEEVFSKPAFQTWAEENVVLLKLDFPRQTEQPEALAKQNRALAQKYGIRGFPTILLLTEEGQVIGRLGYQKGGPDPWVKAAQAAIDDYNRRTRLAAGDDLSEALEQAGSQQMPLLVVATQDKAQAGKVDEGLFTQPAFYMPGNLLTVPVHVDLASESGASKKWAELAKPLAISDRPGVYVLDANAEKLLASGKLDAPAGKLGKLIAGAVPEIPYDGSWTEDYAKARRIALQQGRPLLLDFTGSDWCVWCHRLDDEVFAKDAFKEYAKDNLVLVKLDFPRKTKQPKEIATRNRALAERYGIRGFPTLIVLNPSGEQIGKLGYVKGGPKAFLAKLTAQLE